MHEVRIVFPKSDEEKAEAQRLYDEGKAASGEDRPPPEQVLELPGDAPIGELFMRGRGRKRWTTLGLVVGRITLDPAKEYKLRLTATAFAPLDIVHFLTGVNCDLLTEIETPLAVSQTDWWDQAVSGKPWVQQAIDREQVKVQAALKTSARLVFTIELIDFDSLAE